MLCEICGKKEATVHLTEVINEQMRKLNLCEDCAREKGAEMEEHFGLSDLLAGLADLGATVKPEAAVTIKCPKCGFSYSDFKKIGRLGCSECYEVFKKQLTPILKRIHSADRHVGKVPIQVGKTVKGVKDLQDLRLQMEKAIQSEEFEEAARIRDKMKELEKKNPESRDKK
ncbi:MAG: UvrB/UvrC motif-containing protein [Candidatus Omnitrophica bacterium]|nr:UvrB/UvrC motif-containing protein [Candidatus Omnitrophota bacterium]